jgi:hypothetical protein
MPFTIEKLPDEPIIVVKLKVDGREDFERSFQPLIEQIAAVAAAIPGPVYRVTDLSEVNISFGELVLAMQQEYRSQTPGTAGDPRIQVVLVTSDKMIEIAAKSTQRSIHYGQHAPPPIFPTTEDALKYIRGELKKLI